MFIKDLKRCKKFLAGDHTVLRELLHPGKADLELRYSLAHAVLAPGKVSKDHRLRTSEVYYILKGTGLMSIDGKTARVRPGQAVYIPPRSRQHIKNTGRANLEFICIVDPAWRAEDEIIL